MSGAIVMILCLSCGSVPVEGNYRAAMEWRTYDATLEMCEAELAHLMARLPAVTGVCMDRTDAIAEAVAIQTATQTAVGAAVIGAYEAAEKARMAAAGIQWPPVIKPLPPPREPEPRPTFWEFIKALVWLD
jgi:hypothetical protein